MRISMEKTRILRPTERIIRRCLISILVSPLDPRCSTPPTHHQKCLRIVSGARNGVSASLELPPPCLVSALCHSVLVRRLTSRRLACDMSLCSERCWTEQEDVNARPTPPPRAFTSRSLRSVQETGRSVVQRQGEQYDFALQHTEELERAHHSGDAGEPSLSLSPDRGFTASGDGSDSVSLGGGRADLRGNLDRISCMS